MSQPKIVCVKMHLKCLRYKIYMRNSISLVRKRKFYSASVTDIVDNSMEATATATATEAVTDFQTRYVCVVIANFRLRYFQIRFSSYSLLGILGVCFQFSATHIETHIRLNSYQWEQYKTTWTQFEMTLTQYTCMYVRISCVYIIHSRDIMFPMYLFVRQIYVWYVSISI